MPAPTPAPAPGWSLPGYALERLLGFGGAGEVWQARELASGDRVALKRLRPGGAGTADLLRREAAVLVSVAHPHVLRLRGVRPTPDGVVLVLDLAPGGSLAALLATRGRLDPGEVVTIAGPLAQGLDAAHARGIVHGDVTPSNLLFAADGRPLLADLGVARLVGDPGPTGGTAEYLDPQQAAGGPATPAGDVHGLAACCYHALTGRPPFEGPTVAATLAVAAEGVHPPLAALAPQAPPGLVVLLESALQADPARRPTAAAFAAALLEAAPAAPVRLLDTAPLLVRAPLTHDVEALPVPASASVQPSRWRAVPAPRSLAALAVAVVLGVVAAGVGTQALPPPAPPAVALEPVASAASELDLDLVAVYTELSARRDAALAAGDLAALDGVYTADAAARAGDSAAVVALRSREARAEGLAHTVISVAVRTRGEGSATLDVTDTLAAYRIVGPDGAVLAEQPRRSEAALVVEVVLTDRGWRVADLTPA